VILATVSAFKDLPYIETWGDVPVLGIIGNQRGTVPAYQEVYQKVREQHHFITYVHDDVECLEEDWHHRIAPEFDDPKVAIVGFGGATGMGVDSIYKVPYDITQLQRIDYYSNQVGWQIHGKRETGARDVAVVDGFAMAVRTSFLDQIGGWKGFNFNFHGYDLYLCLMAHRKGWKVRMVGVHCDHHGGRTSCSAEYITWCREHGTTPEREHTEPHAFLYDHFRDVLPLRVR